LRAWPNIFRANKELKMSRKIKKKVIDDNLTFSDNFDENVLDRIENELGKSESEAAQLVSKRRKTTGAGASQEGFNHESGLDRLDSDSGEIVTDFSLQDKGQEPAAPGPEPGDKEPINIPLEKKTLHRKIITKKWILSTLALVFFVILPGLAWFQLQRQHPKAPAPLQMIRHPVPIPHFQQETSFFILAGAGGKKDLIELGMEFEFTSSGAFDNFQGQLLLFQDAVYRFLQTRNPLENTYRHWSKIVQDDLPAYLKVSIPTSRVESITMTQFNRL
jgi:hypothetical protein